MTMPLIPTRFEDDRHWGRKTAESVNGILQFHHDDSRVKTAAESAASLTPIKFSFQPGDIRRYGAVGDDATDCTQAFKDAVAQYANGGPEVIIPEGTFKIAGRITISSANGLKMRGMGYKSVVRCANASTFIFFLFEHPSFTAINGVRLRNFRIDANGSGQLDAGIVQLNNCVGFVVGGLWIENASRASGSQGVNGIAMSSGSLGGTQPRGVIKGCTITNCSKAGINCSSETGGVDITGNIVHDNTGIGTTPGIQIFGGRRIRVRGNQVFRNQGPGIFVATDSNNIGPEYALISGNHIYENGQGTTQGEGIAVQNAQSVVSGRIIIRGNHVYSNGVNVTGGSAGILFQNERRGVIQGNYIYNNRSNGIEVEKTTNDVHEILISGNQIENNNQANNSNGAGVRVKSVVQRLVISNNHIFDNQGTPTQDWAVRFEGSAVIDDVAIEDNYCYGHDNTQNFSLDTGATFRRMRFRLDWRWQTTDGTNKNILGIELPDDSAVLIKSAVVGVKSDGTDRAGYERTALIYRDGGGATVQGAVATPFTEESNASWNSTIVVGSNQLAAQITGVAATTINWRGQLEAISV